MYLTCSRVVQGEQHLSVQQTENATEVSESSLEKPGVLTSTTAGNNSSVPSSSSKSSPRKNGDSPSAPAAHIYGNLPVAPASENGDLQEQVANPGERNYSAERISGGDDDDGVLTVIDNALYGREMHQRPLHATTGLQFKGPRPPQSGDELTTVSDAGCSRAPTDRPLQTAPAYESIVLNNDVSPKTS